MKKREPNDRYESMALLDLKTKEILDRVNGIESTIKKLEAVVDSLYAKAQISHSLLVVRKVDEEKVRELEK